MSPFLNEPSDHRQVSDTLTGDSAYDLQNNRCPKCDRFGVVSGMDGYYGIIYHCNCLPVFWVISPETGEKLEGG